jgi:hypothetical protein
MVYRDGYLFAASYHEFPGLVIIDVRDPGRPRLAASLRLAPLTDLAVVGDLVYALDGVRITAVDVSDPEQPRLVRGTMLPDYASGVADAAPYLLVADGDAGAWVYRTAR